MGSGGLIVMDEDTCIVDLAQIFPGICSRRIVRKCTPAE